MEVKRPVEPNPATACRRRGPSADDARRNGYRNTRIERRHGCVVGTTTAFLERSGPDSTVVSASVDIRNKLVGVMSILLTLFRSNVCWAKPNHAFFYCQHSFAIFFLPTVAARHVRASESPRARAYPSNREARSPNSVFEKALLFRCFFLSRALARLPEHFVRTAAKPMRRHGLPPVRQLKIFYPTAALPTSHEQKCANLSSVWSVMHAAARTDCGIHRVH